MLAFSIAGLAIVATVLMMLARTNLKRWLGYVNLVDVSFTFAMFSMMHNSFSGIISAAFAGSIMSVSLQVIRKLVGCEKLKARRVPWYKGWLRLNWVYYAPAELTFYGMKSIGARDVA